jgi:hypothetical protein
MLMPVPSKCEASMRYRAALLLALCSGSGVAQETPVAVFVGMDHAASARVLNSLEREVEDAVGPSGIRVSWRAMDASQFSQVYERIAMVRLRGECRVGAPLPRQSAKAHEPLGQTHVSDGKVLPIADIRCDSVRRVIYKELQAADSDQRDELLGRALGRVAAHELYHMLLRTMEHGREGLARPAQSSSDLLAAHTHFGQQEEKRLSESFTADTEGSADAGR